MPTSPIAAILGVERPALEIVPEYPDGPTMVRPRVAVCIFIQAVQEDIRPADLRACRLGVACVISVTALDKAELTIYAVGISTTSRYQGDWLEIGTILNGHELGRSTERYRMAEMQGANFSNPGVCNMSQRHACPCMLFVFILLPILIFRNQRPDSVKR